MFMCIFGLIIFVETTPSQRKGRGIYIAISFLIFTLYTLSELGDGYEIFELLLNTRSPLEAHKLRRIDDHQWWSIACSIGSPLINWIVDGLLKYTLGLCTTGRWIPLFSCLVLSSTDLHSYRYSPHAFSAWIFLSAALNCMITILISYKLIKIRLEVAKLLHFQDSRPTNSVVSILVESALPLSISGISTAAAVLLNSTGGLIFDAVALFLWGAFNALSPQFIIFRVTIGRSWSHEGPKAAGSTPENHRSSLNISFAHSSLQPSDGDTYELPKKEHQEKKSLSHDNQVDDVLKLA
ncbi:hypothetical protein CPB83DRAFT_559972 [Crepidotus variabilis]|uniref:Uncharacterized protein n=1 Tax=Crepidotus variabilis TaxID=179855 RepID=A0A9P6E9G4_9AGAR|nr:hypothetical protein CPB83DRAFT_559972 [Crepidotus variabilis]